MNKFDLWQKMLLLSFEQKLAAQKVSAADNADWLVAAQMLFFALLVIAFLVTR